MLLLSTLSCQCHCTLFNLFKWTTWVIVLWQWQTIISPLSRLLHQPLHHALPRLDELFLHILSGPSFVQTYVPTFCTFRVRFVWTFQPTSVGIIRGPARYEDRYPELACMTPVMDNPLATLHKTLNISYSQSNIFLCCSQVLLPIKKMHLKMMQTITCPKESPTVSSYTFVVFPQQANLAIVNVKDSTPFPSSNLFVLYVLQSSPCLE